MIHRVLISFFLMGVVSFPAIAAEDAGPKYDLIFGVYLYSRGKIFDVENYFYVQDNGLLEVQYGPIQKGTTSDLWIMLYRYDWKTKRVTLVPTPGPEQIAGTTTKEYYIVEATEHLRLIPGAVSPDGYELAEPQWVTAGPVSQVLGNIALLMLAGGVEKVKERETMPRIARGTFSFPMKGKDEVLPSDDATAFSLGWVKR